MGLIFFRSCGGWMATEWETERPSRCSTTFSAAPSRRTFHGVRSAWRPSSRLNLLFWSTCKGKRILSTNLMREFCDFKHDNRVMNTQNLSVAFGLSWRFGCPPVVRGWRGETVQVLGPTMTTWFFTELGPSVLNGLTPTFCFPLVTTLTCEWSIPGELLSLLLHLFQVVCTRRWNDL